MQVRDSMPSPPEWKLRFVQDTDSLLLLDVLGAVFAAGESDGRQLQGPVVLGGWGGDTDPHSDANTV